MTDEVAAREIRHLVENTHLKAAFAKLEADAYEELLRIPGWMNIVRPAKARALIERIRALRDVQARLASLGRTPAAPPVRGIV